LFLYSCLGHDSLEEKFFDDKKRHYTEKEFREHLKIINEPALLDRIVNIISRLTRRGNKGTDLNYVQSAQRITDTNEDLEFAIVTKLGDRLHNARTLKPIIKNTTNKDLEWNLKTLFKSVVLVNKIDEGYESKNSKFRWLIKQMMQDILLISYEEIDKIGLKYMHNAANFEGKTDYDIDIMIPVRSNELRLNPKTLGFDDVTSFGYPHHFELSPKTRKIYDYFPLIDRMVFAWKYERKDADKINRVGLLAYKISRAKKKGHNDRKVDSPIRFFDGYFNSKLNENHQDKNIKNEPIIDPHRFYNGMLHSWARSYYIADLIMHSNSKNTQPYPLGLIELAFPQVGAVKKNATLRQVLESDSYEMLSPRSRNIADCLFGYALCSYLSLSL